MKNIVHISTKLTCSMIISVIFLINPYVTFGQAGGNGPVRISLQEAIWKAKENNKTIQVSKIEKEASVDDLKDARAGILPSINASGSYQRFTKLTLYTNGLSSATSIPKNPGPNGADFGVSASFNLYSGGRTRALLSEQEHRSSLAGISVTEIAGNIGLQTAAQYLDLIRLSGQKKLIEDQKIRAETRLRNINALYRNQKITRSDVLRAELMLSNVSLLLEQTENDIVIGNKKLNVLMDLPEDILIQIQDTLGTENMSIDDVQRLTQIVTKEAFGIKKINENIKIQDARIKGLKSNYYPSLSANSFYGINYPNTIFHPPVDQAYSIGFVGLKLQYNLSSLYQNRHKVSAGNSRLRELEIQKASLADNVNQEAVSLGIKYQEAMNRITVVKKQIELASANYKIVSSKYFNQLALLTDLLEADNLFQESRYNLIQAQTGLKFIFYRLQFTSGKL